MVRQKAIIMAGVSETWPATSYTFTVEARDSNGNTTTSNPVTLTTEATSDVTPPSAPTNVRIVDGGCVEFWVGSQTFRI
jgi:chitodextrinase